MISEESKQESGYLASEPLGIGNEKTRKQERKKNRNGSGKRVAQVVPVTERRTKLKAT